MSGHRDASLNPMELGFHWRRGEPLVKNLVKSQCELNHLRWLTKAPKFHWDCELGHHLSFGIVASAKKLNGFSLTEHFGHLAPSLLDTEQL